MSWTVARRRAVYLLVALTVTYAGSLSPLASAPAGAASSRDLTGISSLAVREIGQCALLRSTAVDCWGTGLLGSLGNGKNYDSLFTGEDVPTPVRATSGSGDLTGVSSLLAGGATCAVLRTGEMDCWGYGGDGALGIGTYKVDSTVPVPVLATSGSGPLTGVASAVKMYEGVCALLTDGGVDCWGSGVLGTGSPTGGLRPAPVESPSGAGDLSGVTSLTSDGTSVCAILVTSGVDCWGDNGYDDLGDGSTSAALTAEAVVSTTGTGTLTGVQSLAAARYGYCALLDTGSVDCWGFGFDGQLGDGHVIPWPQGTDVPVAVVSTTGTGTLTGVRSLTGYMAGFCAVLATTHVDCWGEGGELGDGKGSVKSPQDSAVPVTVLATVGTGALTGVASLTSDDVNMCARLTSGRVDCWGNGLEGALGNKRYYSSTDEGSTRPVAVVGVGGTGVLSGVASVSSTGSISSSGGGFCALLTTGEAACWGDGQAGELGDGSFHHTAPHGSDVPVMVRS